MNLRTALVAALILGLSGRSALGQTALEVSLKARAQVGQGQPSLTIRANQRLGRVRLNLVRSTDGRRIKSSAGPIAPGAEHRFALPLSKPGSARFKGTLVATVADGGQGSMPLDLEVHLLPVLELEVSPEDLSVEERRMAIRSSRPLERVELTIVSDTGEAIGQWSGRAKAGEDGRSHVRWQQEEGRVLRIAVRGYDEDGFFSSVDLFPWRVDIPHEDVEFETGEAVIRASEEPKLDRSLRLLQQALRMYGRLASGLCVFVAGHTDTVGDPASNRVLSERRARAIGRWFRRRGVEVPIRYAGLGESVPFVATPDETPEAKNRRAEYIVAITPPRFSEVSVVWRHL